MNEYSFITKLYSNILREYDFGTEEKYIIAEFVNFYIPKNYVAATFLYRLRFALQDRIKRLKAEGSEIAHWVVVFDEVNNFIHDSKKKAAEQSLADSASIDPYTVYRTVNFSTSNLYTYTTNTYTTNTYATAPYTTNYATAFYSTNYGINNYITSNYVSNYVDTYYTL